MSIETTLYNALIAESTLTALVSSGSPLDHRIYPMVAEDNDAVPYITYQVIATVAHNKISGAPETERKLVQINCVADTYAAAKSVAEAVKTAMNNATGYLSGEGDDYFSQTERYRVRLDFSLIG